MANPETVEPSDQMYFTADMVRDLIREDRAWPRYECVYGELLVTPAPVGPHQIIVSRLLHGLMTYVGTWPSQLTALASPADISWGRDDVTVQPDVFVIPRDMARAIWHSPSWDPVRHLSLAVEVISPSSRRDDRFRKRKLYQDRRVPLYWIVDPETQVAEVWTPDVHFPTIERERLVWQPEGATEPLTMVLAELFAEP